ncbi:hypothetical protein NSK_008472 [Nannochloropsis salina CCMP1776]|uniref:Beta-ketoacyl-[acyl-carrier-protein] synthase III N-terminal domain-containing protein n=1 Tax=Nannochloropsis salina CCMP1776 TaxID=1027361 RepID=A0A4D9CN45_9STRA|nr:hypothetical protein NSK_008472 [Nannochloropsis salina CCMP1776]|eukprot:TFJ80186.1 hypothetical protein NSK_008472 [Nannochloropsis salina CCMP1776]
MGKRSRASGRGLAYIQRLHLLSLSLCLLLPLQCSIRAAAFLVPSSPLPSLPSSPGLSLPSSRPSSSVPKSRALHMATSLTEGSSVDAPAAVPGRSFLRAKPIGVGSAAPEDVITNTDLESIVETSDEWIFTRTGISQRRILTSGGQIRALAATAAARALASAGLEGKDIDLVVLATSSPDDLFGDATSVAAAVGATQAVAFDLTAACSGFLFGVVSASQFLHSGCYRRALVVGADALSRWVDWEDRNSCILFGDGAGAVVLEAAEGDEDSGVLGFAMHSDGTDRKGGRKGGRDEGKDGGREGGREGKREEGGRETGKEERRSRHLKHVLKGCVGQRVEGPRDGGSGAVDEHVHLPTHGDDGGTEGGGEGAGPHGHILGNEEEGGRGGGGREASSSACCRAIAYHPTAVEEPAAGAHRLEKIVLG